jgi:hypothetical protein
MARTLLLCLALAYSGLGVAQVDCIKQQAKLLVGTREGPVNNRGPKVDSIVRFAGGTPGQAWCSYTLIYLWKKCGVPYRGVNGMAMSWAKKERLVRRDLIMSPDHFTIYNKVLGRIGHVGIVFRTYPEESFFLSFEGNINSRGDRESRRSKAGHLVREYYGCNGYYRWW